MSLELFTELEQGGAKHTLLAQRGAYKVMRHNNFCFLSSGGRAIQGAMDENEPHVVQSPVVSAMLEAVALTHNPLAALNLGIGCAAIERHIAHFSSRIELHSVDVSREVIELAGNYFGMPKTTVAQCIAAESFVHACTQCFDIIFCDLALGERPASCLGVDGFQRDCARLVSDNGVFVMNLLCNSNIELKEALLKWRRHFPWIAIYPVPYFDNVVVYAAHNAPSSRLSTVMQNRCAHKALSSALILP